MTPETGLPAGLVFLSRVRIAPDAGRVVRPPRPSKRWALIRPLAGMGAGLALCIAATMLLTYQPAESEPVWQINTVPHWRPLSSVPTTASTTPPLPQP